MRRLTHTIDGGVLIGPSALLAFARDGYSFDTIDRRELRLTLGGPGFSAMARRHWRTGAEELYRAFNRRAFVGEARRGVMFRN